MKPVSCGQRRSYLGKLIGLSELGPGAFFQTPPLGEPLEVRESGRGKYRESKVIAELGEKRAGGMS